MVAFAVEFGAGGDSFEGDEFGQCVYQFVYVLSIFKAGEVRGGIPLLIGGISSWFMENSVKSQIPTVLSLPPVA